MDIIRYFFQDTPNTFRLQSIGHGEPDPVLNRLGPYIRDHYVLHYVFSGEGTLEMNGQIHQIGQGDLFIIPPDVVATYTANPERPWGYTWINFYAERPLDFLDKPVLRQAPVGHLFEKIRDYCTSDESDLLAYSLLYELLWKLHRPKTIAAHRPLNSASFLRAHIENNYMTQFSIEEIADSLHVDRRHLTYVFRKAYGISPKVFLTRLRMSKAREFLDRGYSVNLSATMAGFTDLSNFTKMFTDYYGLTPASYRRQLQSSPEPPQDGLP